MQEVGTKIDLPITEQNESEESSASTSINHGYLVLKRLIDILAAGIGMVLLSPVYIFIIVLVKLDSEGPVFFSHNRIGKNGNIIKVYKFRTMVTNAEEILKNLPEDKKKEFEKNFKFDDDPRITKIGKVLRETSLDELPQLLNILIGNMSVVGPRPIVRDEVKMYGSFASKLVSVKPGLTGYWQANGRSDTTYKERVAMDMYYIDNMSLWLDLKIVFKTAISVFRKEGAR